jgi:hypothetical protein
MLPLSVEIWCATTPTDLRRGPDGLSGLVRSQLHADPLSGHLFVFFNRKADRLKILYWAVGYALSHWAALMRYTEQAYLSIDNNLSERALRLVVVGRANWQFCGSAEGGRTAAVLYSVVGTCKHLGIDPVAYMREALPALSGIGEGPGDGELARWLPDAWQQRQRQCIVALEPTQVTGEPD